MELTCSRLCALVCAVVVCLQLAACGSSSTSTASSAPASSPAVPAQPTFTAHPKYFIGSVVYTPPGEGGSLLTYGFGTVTGTTVSTTQNWNNHSMTGVSAGDHFVAFGDNFGGSTSTSVDVQDNPDQLPVSSFEFHQSRLRSDLDILWCHRECVRGRSREYHVEPGFLANIESGLRRDRVFHCCRMPRTQ
jgi:hypothetical protein